MLTPGCIQIRARSEAEMRMLMTWERRGDSCLPAQSDVEHVCDGEASVGITPLEGRSPQRHPRCVG